MSSADSVPVDIREALISAYRISRTTTATLPGNIPSLLAHAYSRHFRTNMPLIQDQENDDVPSSSYTLELLLAKLVAIPPLSEKAQTLLDRARSILTDGPPLSMNIELADGQELPDALHTLLQGTLWAILMGAGAYPELDGSTNDPTASDDDSSSYESSCYSSDAVADDKSLWFLCRKFLFVHQAAQKDGEAFSNINHAGYYIEHRYAGFLFKTNASYDPLERARLPRVLSVYRDRISTLVVTPKGVYGWNGGRNLGLGSQVMFTTDPTRLTFRNCPAVLEYESALPAWEKDRIATLVRHSYARTLILTPVGLVAAGVSTEMFTRQMSNGPCFHMVPLPEGFVPDHIMDGEKVVVLSMGDRQMIAGENSHGELGIGEAGDLSGFVDLPYRIDGIIASASDFNVFLSGRQLLFTGVPPAPLLDSNLHPGQPGPTPTPLTVPKEAWAFGLSWGHLVWVGGGRTHRYGLLGDLGSYYINGEASHCGSSRYRLTDGSWVDVLGVHDGVGRTVECRPDPDGVLEIPLVRPTERRV
ncbi:hypothetical protein J8273_3067 [Carpediemonas membranifera]|uniref:Uncharacterized protein n=1 Tax=Carpediemonas membranifera TaxID=201153 RepID=A0A8J6AV22_9EUKA|nr:hypothetical protein J8273_3067 [Carpediemonas membranifera]|eukprot:KAG9395491.1 hypothetical protein J8273_3067 [Carpediemonas membranifera]